MNPLTKAQHSANEARRAQARQHALGVLYTTRNDVLTQLQAITDQQRRGLAVPGAAEVIESLNDRVRGIDAEIVAAQAKWASRAATSFEQATQPQSVLPVPPKQTKPEKVRKQKGAK